MCVCEALRLFSSSGCLTLSGGCCCCCPTLEGFHAAHTRYALPALPCAVNLALFLAVSLCPPPALLLPLPFVTSSAKINRLEFAFLSLFHIARQISCIIQSSYPCPASASSLPTRIVLLQLLHISSHKPPPPPHCAPNPTKFSHCVSL